MEFQGGTPTMKGAHTGATPRGMKGEGEGGGEGTGDMCGGGDGNGGDGNGGEGGSGSLTHGPQSVPA